MIWRQLPRKIPDELTFYFIIFIIEHFLAICQYLSHCNFILFFKSHLYLNIKFNIFLF